MLIQATARKIAKLTQLNNTTESLIVLAKFLGDKEAVEKLEDIDKEHTRTVHLPDNLKADRYKIYSHLLQRVRIVHGEDAYKTIYKSL